MARNTKVEFTYAAPQAYSVELAGTFNDWDPSKSPMRQGRDGIWRIKASLPSGRHEYRFVVDGQWVSDPNAVESVLNPYGSENSVIYA